MKPANLHTWRLTESEAIRLQKQLAPKIIQHDQFEEIGLVAGVDVAYGENEDELAAAVVVLQADTLEIVEIRTATDTVSFPYIPGLFSFRELPPLIKALEKLENTPDLIICDGQGRAHPRRFGLASHLGLLFDVPTIGCGKTRLTGDCETPEELRGSSAPIIDNDETIGLALRTQDYVKPVYISTGHRISLETAKDWILKVSPQYRLPETTRMADQCVRRALREGFVNS